MTQQRGTAETLAMTFEERFGGAPDVVVRAPGRVNLIGEHTDYNDGYVLPAAIDYDVTIACRARSDRTVRLYSALFGERASFRLDRIGKARTQGWTNYVRGIAAILQASGHALAGMDALIAGTVPLSSGLSSSAALETAACLAFEISSGFRLGPVERALVAQRAEREFVGVQCGIMDQFIACLGRADHALFIDTRSLAYEPTPLPEQGVALIIGNTNKQRGLVDSEYNTRRAECEEAVRVLQLANPNVQALRDVSLSELDAARNRLSERTYRRARHVITENDRVLASVRALREGRIAEFGRWMNDSHDSLRDDYEVSCAELDAMVEAARGLPETFGSRMTGAGFGGCTVSLVASDAVPRFMDRVGEAYKAATGRTATFYACRASDGARVVWPAGRE